MKTITAILIGLFTCQPVFATDYFLDVDATGTDTGASLTNAFVSFAQVSASSFGAGDTLYISGGTTSKTYSLAAKFAFTASNITIKVATDTDHDGIVVIDGGDTVTQLFDLYSRDSITIDGEVDGERHIRFQNWGGAGAGGESFAMRSDNIETLTLRYVEFINDDTTCSQSDCSDIELKNCAKFRQTYNSSLIEYNYFEGCIRNNLGAGAFEESLTTYDATVIQYNEMKGYKNALGKGGPDGIKGGGNSTIRYNKIYHVELADAEYNPSHVAEDGIQITAPYSKVYGNEVYGYSQGAIRTDFVTTLSHLYFYNNLLYADDTSTGQRGIQLDIIGGIDDTHIYNNTIVGFGTLGIDVSTRAETTLADVDVYNNILIDSPMRIDTDGTGLDITVDYNLCLEADFSDQGCDVTQTNEPFNVAKTFAFTSYTFGAADNDFHLANTDNMAIGAAVDLSSSFTDDITKDLRNTWDLGAYEYDPTALKILYIDALGNLLQ